MKKLLFCILLSAFAVTGYSQICTDVAYPHGSNVINSIDQLEKDCKAGNWGDVHVDYFSNGNDPVYDKSLPDIFCYIDNTYTVHEGMSYHKVWSPKGNANNPVLWGEKNAWVIVLLDRKIGDAILYDSARANMLRDEVDSLTKIQSKAGIDPKQKTAYTNQINAYAKQIQLICHPTKKEQYQTTFIGTLKGLSFLKVDSAKIAQPMPKGPSGDSITFAIKREVLNYQPGPTEYSLAGLIGGTISLISGGKAAVSTATAATLKDSTIIVKLVKYWDATHKNYIYGALVHFSLLQNTKNRIVISPVGEIDSLTSYHFNGICYNFGNYERTWVDFSVGTGFTLNYHTNDSWNPSIAPLNVYAFLDVFIPWCRPRLPVTEWSVAAVFGTNIIGPKLANQLVMGLRAGLGANFGILGGVVFPQGDGDPVFSLNRNSGMLGIDYKF